MAAVVQRGTHGRGGGACGAQWLGWLRDGVGHRRCDVGARAGKECAARRGRPRRSKLLGTGGMERYCDHGPAHACPSSRYRASLGIPPEPAAAPGLAKSIAVAISYKSDASKMASETKQQEHYPRCGRLSSMDLPQQRSWEHAQPDQTFCTAHWPHLRAELREADNSSGGELAGAVGVEETRRLALREAGGGMSLGR
ncbi:unnamed protein product [Miscanthus lutarioriparius]|uniref:Uncharacterized protein n=1 Tax=Miscanthus lutarioriparius TaxID=422564 RepID=A0A811R4J3_9POAL|nr:unnamed protein product [Miscanthus lutarioriparius]